MKTGPRFAIVIFLIVGAYFAAPRKAAAASTYYISSTSGNDNNDGQSPEKAWKSLSKIFLKSTSQKPFQPGDSVLLKRGDRWEGQIRLQASGTAEKPVTLGAYGQGQKPLLYGEDQQARWEPVAGHQGIYTTDMEEGSILGSLVVDGNVLQTLYPSGTLNRNEDIEIFFARLQPGTLAGKLGSRLWLRVKDDKSPDTTVRLFRSAGVSLSNSNYVQIENLDIEHFQTGIDITNSQHILVDDNDIQDVLGIGIYLRSGDVDCRVESNTVFRGGNTALYVLKGSGNIFRDNWVSHVDTRILGIGVSGDQMGIGLQESQQSLVEYNYFAHSGGMDFYYERGSTVRYNYLYQVRSAGAPHGVNLKVYGNIYNLAGPTGKPGSTGINAVATGPGTIEVFNNTIFNASAFFLMGSSDKGGKVEFSDNLVFSSAPGTAMTMFKTTVASGHNCFSAPGQPIFRFSNAIFSSLKTYQTSSGLDRDSVIADPHFLSSTPVTPLDFRPSANSGCNLPASHIALADPANGRTYDHDDAGAAAIGALQANKASPDAAPTQRCNSHCFHHPFAVPSGVYLMRLKFAPSAHSGREFTFVVNGKRVTAEFEPFEGTGADDTYLYFLVRPNAPSITLEADAYMDVSIVTEVDIMPFDASHGQGLQVIPW
jgi:hypothetical protein